MKTKTTKGIRRYNKIQIQNTGNKMYTNSQDYILCSNRVNGCIMLLSHISLNIVNHASH